MKRLDLTGQKFGMLTAIGRTVDSTSDISKWHVSCDCGTETIVRLGNLRNGHTTSCGCVREMIIRQRSLKHGHEIDRKPSRTLKSYRHAKSRSTNPTDPKYARYGGRGIFMCDQWLNSFETFLADMGECPKGMSIDRIDNNGNYEPGNCRWATAAMQSRNKSNNVTISHNGRIMILTDYANEVGIPFSTLRSRLDKCAIEKVARIFKR